MVFSHASRRYVLVQLCTAIAMVGAPAAVAHAQTVRRPLSEREESRSLDLAVDHVGLSFGNSPRHTGLRFNLRDENVRRINGINATFWMPGDSPRGEINAPR